MPDIAKEEVEKAKAVSRKKIDNVTRPNSSRPTNQHYYDKSRKPSFHLEPKTVFCGILVVRLIAAYYSPIQDCDEVFNYWEPSHYLSHGNGFQTWEYSPEYAIRSWVYAGLHSLIMLPGKLIPFSNGKTAEFYLLRMVLGAACAACEARLYGKISQTLNPRVGVLFLLVMLSSPGMYHASIAYLPSSFAMYTTMLGMAAFMDWRGGLRTAQGIFCIGVGSVLGWPFAVAMAIPFLAEEVLFATISDDDAIVKMCWRFVDGTIRTLLVLGIQVGVDSYFYKKLVVVPFNIVWYNVLAAGRGKGPNIYGTEPWHFYLRNLTLNFSLWLPLALASMPLLLIQQSVRGTTATKQSYLRGITFLAPFYLWLAIFTLQPHKEERFMYPAYPALALNAAVALHVALSWIGALNRIPVQIRLAGIASSVAVTLGLSIFRTLGTLTAYSAPLSVYAPLHEANMTRPGNTICLGKEWYRFPSHFHLPPGVKAKFIKSEFDGLLPGEYSEAKMQGFGLWAGTYLVPPGMNDENREDIGKYTDVRHCNFLVDSSLPSTKSSDREPDFVHDEEQWMKIKCLPFLDAASTGFLGRLGWVPDLPFIPARYRRVWGDYCLLKRKR